MPVSVEISGIGHPEATAVEEAVREVMTAVSGQWRLSIVGSQLNDIWELNVQGPNTNRSYELYGTDGQHEPEFIRELLTDSFAPIVSSVSRAVPVPAAWSRLTNGSGGTVDVHDAIRFISEHWSKGLHDFSVAQKWGRLTSAELSRSRAALERERQVYFQEFDSLVRGVGRGPVAYEFFRSLLTLSTAVKEIAYIKGFRGASDDNRGLRTMI